MQIITQVNTSAASRPHIVPFIGIWRNLFLRQVLTFAKHWWSEPPGYNREPRLLMQPTFHFPMGQLTNYVAKKRDHTAILEGSSLYFISLLEWKAWIFHAKAFFFFNCTTLIATYARGWPTTRLIFSEQGNMAKYSLNGKQWTEEIPVTTNNNNGGN